MIPILMQDDTTVGFLKEAMSCVVTEERNGVFELTLTYPVTGAPAPEISYHVSTGFVIGRETPDAVLSEDGEHIDLYAVAALNRRATQELLERIEQLKNKTPLS